MILYPFPDILEPSERSGNKPQHNMVRFLFENPVEIKKLVTAVCVIFRKGPIDMNVAVNRQLHCHTEVTAYMKRYSDTNRPGRTRDYHPHRPQILKLHLMLFVAELTS